MVDTAGATIVVEETHAGLFQVQVDTGTAKFLADEPISVGGMSTGPSPYGLLSAALGTCTVMTVRLYARRQGIPLENVSARITHHRAGGGKDKFIKEIQLLGPLSAADRERLFAIAQKCPVHLTLERGAEVETALTQPDADMLRPQCANEHAQDMEKTCAR